MLALLLYLWVGPHAALAEIAAEVLIGLSATGGGGGGRRLRDALRAFLARLRWRRLAPA